MTKFQGEANPSDKAVSDQICDFDVTEVGRHLSGRPRKQTGWVEKTDSGKKWCGYYYVYEEAPDGTEKRRQRSRVLGACKKMTKTEAEDELARLIGEELHIPKEAREIQTMQQLWRVFYDDRAARWSKAEQMTATSVWNHWLKPRLDKTDVRSITRLHLQRVLNEISVSKRKLPNGENVEGVSESLLQKLRKYLYGAFDLAVEMRIVPQNPTLKLKKPKHNPTRKPTLSPEAFSQFLLHLSARDSLLVRICMQCGLRPSETFGLRYQDVLPTALYVRQSLDRRTRKLKETKTPGSTAMVPLPPALAAELQHWIRAYPGGSEELIFTNTLGQPIRAENYLKRVIHKAGKKAGVKVSFQIMRRSAGTYLQRHGTPKDVQSIMRHADIETTFGTYVQPIAESTKAAAAAFEQEIRNAQLNLLQTAVQGPK